MNVEMKTQAIVIINNNDPSPEGFFV